MEFFAIVIGLIVLDVAALRWGVDSRDGPDSAELAHHRPWRA